MKRKTALLLLAILVAVGGVAIWKIRDTKAKAAKLESEILKGLTEEELIAILENQSVLEPGFDFTMANSPERRKSFLRGLREYIVLAARARREGLMEDVGFKRDSELKKNILLATMYVYKVNAARKDPYEISKEQIEAIWKNPENEKQFSLDSQASQDARRLVEKNLGNTPVITPLAGERLEKSRWTWARTKILSDMAKADGEFMNQKAIQLRLKVLEAGTLATGYLNKHWEGSIKATNEEIRTFIATHPEYNIDKKREKAEMLLRRAKAGESFENLAREFSEDRRTKDDGGLYADQVQGSGFLWPELETAALGIENGQIAQNLIETRVGYHIVKLVKKQKTKNDSGADVIKYSVRHILLQKNFEDPRKRNTDIPPVFLPAEEIAKLVVEDEKRLRFINDIVAQENVSLPDDFHIKPAKT